MDNLKELYEKEIIPKMMKKYKYKNVMEVPKLTKIVINIGLTEAKDNPKIIEEGVKELSLITGQKPRITRVKKSIASFKIRKGMPIGCKVTLRKVMMYDFLNRLINVALPRVRDFRGVPRNSFDDNGNYNLGIKENIIFPEIKPDTISKTKGMNITICTTATNKEEGISLLEMFGFPFSKK